MNLDTEKQEDEARRDIHYWENKLRVGKRELLQIEVHIAQLYKKYEKKFKKS